MKALSDRQNVSGFTLIELLVVVIILGILASIGLPSLLNQAAKAKQTSAKLVISSVNRAQQAYRIEKPTFAVTWTDLEIGIPEQDQDYTYTLGASSETTTTIEAESEAPELKDYSGGVVVMEDSGQTSTAACQTIKAGGSAILPTLNRSTGAACDSAGIEVAR